MDIEEIVNQLEEARRAYYNSDTTTISDSEFDALEERLREIAPLHPYFDRVGIAAEGFKITHQIEMLSLDKAKEQKEIERWFRWLNLPKESSFIIQPKIDGLSATCLYREGKLHYVATRGDGKEGQNITHIEQYVDDIPNKIDYPGTIEVRGELYLPKDTEYDTGGKSLRNNCVGLINRKEKREELSHVRFTAYQVYTEEEKSQSQWIHFLSDRGFHTFPVKLVKSLQEIEEYNREYLSSLREEWLYETDGLVVTVDDTSLHQAIDSRKVINHHHHYALAIKPPAQGRESTLIDVEWQVSRQGNLIPVAIFEPIMVAGALLERATLNNFENFVRLAVERGDTLFIERANDVIPFVRENLSKEAEGVGTTGGELKPDICPSCGGPLTLEGVHLKCENRECPERSVQKILYWIRSSNMENIGESTIRTLYEKGKVRSISDIYRLTSDDFLGIEGFAEKKIENFLTQVGQAKSLTVVEFLSRLGIPSVQEKTLRQFKLYTLEAYKTLSLDTMIETSPSKEAETCRQAIVEAKGSGQSRSFLEDLKAKGEKITIEEIINHPSLPKELKESLTTKTGNPKRVLKEWKIDTLNQLDRLNSQTPFIRPAGDFKICKTIIGWRDEKANSQLLEELLDIVEIREEKSSTTLGTVCMTGSGPLGRKELTQKLKELGYHVSSTVTEETTLLLCDTLSGSGSKLKRAREKGVTIQTYTQFFGQQTLFPL